MSKRICLHVLIPAVAPLLFLVVVMTPVDVLGCRNRGLLAVAIAFLSVMAGLGTAIAGLRGRVRGKPEATWWAISTLVLIIPAVLLILFA